MNFIANTKSEYTDTVIALFGSRIFNDNILNNLFEVEEDSITNEPNKYPVLVSIDIKEWEEDTNYFTFSGIDFIYINDTLSGYDYKNNLNMLFDLNTEAACLEDIINTSGIIDKPIKELGNINKKITEIESVLF